MDSRIWGYILHIKPFARQEDILRIKWINEWDLFIEFANGEKYIYDSYTNYFRWICYDKYTITEEQWRNEFKEKLNNIMTRTGVTQEMLAVRLNSSQPMISRYCSGSAMPSQYMIHKIALALNCNDEDLIYQDY